MFFLLWQISPPVENGLPRLLANKGRGGHQVPSAPRRTLVLPRRKREYVREQTRGRGVGANDMLFLNGPTFVLRGSPTPY